MSATRDIKVTIAGDAGRLRRANSLVHPTARVEGTIGPGTKVGPHAWIGMNVTIGAACVIGPGVVIGCDGFGYENVGDRWERKLQNHGVVIEDDVQVGANAVIARGSYRDTVIGTGTRIDALAFVAHNCIVGEHCMIVAHAELSGSVEVGDGAWIGPSACVREHLSIGAGALVGLGAVVVKDVSDGETWAGNPAKRLK